MQNPSAVLATTSLLPALLCSLALSQTDAPELTSIVQQVEKAQPENRRSEEHTSELQSRENLVCRLLLEKKKKTTNNNDKKTVFKLLYSNVFIENTSSAD